MAVAGRPAREARVTTSAPWIARAPASVVRGALVVVGALADRVIKPRSTSYPATPASIVIYSLDGSDDSHT
jgi:hypothetical protein